MDISEMAIRSAPVGAGDVGERKRRRVMLKGIPLSTVRSVQPVTGTQTSGLKLWRARSGKGTPLRSFPKFEETYLPLIFWLEDVFSRYLWGDISHGEGTSCFGLPPVTPAVPKQPSVWVCWWIPRGQLQRLRCGTDHHGWDCEDWSAKDWKRLQPKAGWGFWKAYKKGWQCSVWSFFLGGSLGEDGGDQDDLIGRCVWLKLDDGLR